MATAVDRRKNKKPRKAKHAAKSAAVEVQLNVFSDEASFDDALEKIFQNSVKSEPPISSNT